LLSMGGGKKQSKINAGRGKMPEKFDCEKKGSPPCAENQEERGEKKRKGRNCMEKIGIQACRKEKVCRLVKFATLALGGTRRTKKWKGRGSSIFGMPRC